MTDEKIDYLIDAVQQAISEWSYDNDVPNAQFLLEVRIENGWTEVMYNDKED